MDRVTINQATREVQYVAMEWVLYALGMSELPEGHNERYSAACAARRRVIRSIMKGRLKR